MYINRTYSHTHTHLHPPTLLPAKPNGMNNIDLYYETKRSELILLINVILVKKCFNFFSSSPSHSLAFWVIFLSSFIFLSASYFCFSPGQGCFLDRFPSEKLIFPYFSWHSTLIGSCTFDATTHKNRTERSSTVAIMSHELNIIV